MPWKETVKIIGYKSSLSYWRLHNILTGSNFSATRAPGESCCWGIRVDMVCPSLCCVFLSVRSSVPATPLEWLTGHFLCVSSDLLVFLPVFKCAEVLRWSGWTKLMSMSRWEISSRGVETCCRFILWLFRLSPRSAVSYCIKLLQLVGFH